MVNLFINIYRYFLRHRARLWGMLALLTVAGVLLALRLQFDEDISGFLPTDRHNERINYAYQHIGAANKLVINISLRDTTLPEDRALLMDAVDTLALKMEACGVNDFCKNITYHIDAQESMALAAFVAANMPYFLEPDDYVRIDSLLTAQAIARQLESTKQTLLSPAGMVLRGIFTVDPLLLSQNLLNDLQGFKLNNQFELYDDYLFTSDGTQAVVTLDALYGAAETAHNKQMVDALDRAMEETVRVFDGAVTVEPFGSVFIAQTNANQIRKDTILSVSIAAILILSLLICYFRNFRSLWLVAASVGFGALFALALAGVISGSLSLIAIAAGSVILGIAVNYPLHFLSHSAEGYSAEDSLTDTVQPLTTGNITTVGAFLSLLFISSSAMRDLGIFASLLLVGTVLFVLVFLPHLSKASAMKGKRKGLRFGLLADSRPENHPWILWVVLILTVVCYCFTGDNSFETSLNSINYMTERQQEQMGRMLDQTQGSQHLMYFVSEGGTLDQALERYEQAQSYTDTFARSGIGRYLPSQAKQRQRIEAWNDFWEPRRQEVLDAFAQQAARLGYTPDITDSFTSLLKTDYSPRPASYFDPIVKAMAGNYLSNGEDGRYLVFTLLHIEPSQAAAVEEALNNTPYAAHSFAFDSGSVTRKMVTLLQSSFDYVLYICGFIVFLFLTLSFGRMELSIISFLPLAVSWIWILGIMNVFDIRFNIINIILATFIFGMGDDYTIFMTEGMMYEYTYHKKMMATYKNTVALSALIMLVGIGSLIVARHPAMRSLAQVTIIGMCSVVLTAYIIPATCYRFLTVKKGKWRAYPLTFKNLTATVYSFAAFLAGSLYLTVFAFFKLTVCGRTPSHLLALHRRMQRTARFVIHRVPYTHLTLENPEGETFEKPSVIIANHQSHLDIMAVLMLHPKIIVATNQWVWHSPFYGILIRYAGFFPAESLLTDRLDTLRTKVAEGYSIMIFPEGTRSPDGSIGRFHRGALALAQALDLDITPLLLHGFGDVLPKEDLLLRKGRLHVRILPRMKNTTPHLARWYRDRYQQLCRKTEDASYFTDLVFHQYIYKGADVARSAGKALRHKESLAAALDTLPLTGRVRIEDPGQGEFSLLAALARKNLQIESYIADPKIRNLAACCTLVPANLNYVDQ